MDLEAGALSAVLLRGKVSSETAFAEAVSAGLESGLFLGSGAPAWQFIVEYQGAYGSVPPLDVFVPRFPELLPADAQPGEIAYYADELRKRRLHNALAVGMRESALLLKERNPVGGLERLARLVVEAGADARSVRDVDIAAMALSRWERYLAREGVLPGIETPWPTLNRLIRGWRPEQLIAVVGRPAMGKTWFLCLLAAKCFELGLSPLLVSQEMSEIELSGRIDAYRAKIRHAGLDAFDLTEEERDRLQQSLRDFPETGTPFWIIGDDSVVSIPSLTAKCDQHHPDLLLIDGLYLLHSDLARSRGSQKWEMVGEIANGAKALARSRRIPVVAATQFSRGAKGTEGGLSEIGYADAIGQAADVVIGLFQTEDMHLAGEVLAKVLKQRNGPTGEWRFRWDHENMDFSELAPPEAIEAAEEMLPF